MPRVEGPLLTCKLCIRRDASTAHAKRRRASLSMTPFERAYRPFLRREPQPRLLFFSPRTCARTSSSSLSVFSIRRSPIGFSNPPISPSSGSILSSSFSPAAVMRVTTTRRSSLSRLRLMRPAFSMRSSRRVTSGSRAIMRSPISLQVRPVGLGPAQNAQHVVLRHGDVEGPHGLLEALLQHVGGAQQRDQQFFFDGGKGFGLVNLLADRADTFLSHSACQISIGRCGLQGISLQQAIQQAAAGTVRPCRCPTFAKGGQMCGRTANAPARCAFYSRLMSEAT